MVGTTGLQETTTDAGTTVGERVVARRENATGRPSVAGIERQNLPRGSDTTSGSGEGRHPGNVGTHQERVRTRGNGDRTGEEPNINTRVRGGVEGEVTNAVGQQIGREEEKNDDDNDGNEDREPEMVGRQPVEGEHRVYRRIDNPLYPIVPEDVRVISVATLAEYSTYELYEPEKFALFGVLLKVNYKVGETGKTLYTPMNYGKRLKKEPVEHPYLRMLMFGDLMDRKNANCFALTETREKVVWGTKGKPCGDVCIGDKFCVLNPRGINGILEHGEVDIIDGDVELVPVESPPIPLCSPMKATVGHIKYFVVKHQELVTSGAKLKKFACSGSFCDRQSKLSVNRKCPCYGQSEHLAMKGYILKCDVVLGTPIEGSIDPFGNTRMQVSVDMHDFQSLRFSRFLFKTHEFPCVCKNSKTIDDDQMKRKILKPKLERLVKWVNKHGGWTAVGWHMKGVVEDGAAQGTTDDVTKDSDKVKHHITYLYPTSFRKSPESLDTVPFIDDDDFGQFVAAVGNEHVVVADGRNARRVNL